MALKLGLNLGYWGIGPQGDEAVEFVQSAERAGFDSVWVAESYGSDVVSVLAWLVPQTETIKLGAAIMQVPARPPAAAPGGRGQGAEAQHTPGARPDPDLSRGDRAQVRGAHGGDRRRLDPDLLQRRRLRADLGRARGGGSGARRAEPRGPGDIADAAGRDRRGSRDSAQH